VLSADVHSSLKGMLLTVGERFLHGHQVFLLHFESRVAQTKG
jgi:hypothetical protein